MGNARALRPGHALSRPPLRLAGADAAGHAPPRPGNPAGGSAGWGRGDRGARKGLQGPTRPPAPSPEPARLALPPRTTDPPPLMTDAIICTLTEGALLQTESQLLSHVAEAATLEHPLPKVPRDSKNKTIVGMRHHSSVWSNQLSAEPPWLQGLLLLPRLLLLLYCFYECHCCLDTAATVPDAWCYPYSYYITATTTTSTTITAVSYYVALVVWSVPSCAANTKGVPIQCYPMGDRTTWERKQADPGVWDPGHQWKDSRLEVVLSNHEMGKTVCWKLCTGKLGVALKVVVGFGLFWAVFLNTGAGIRWAAEGIGGLKKENSLFS
ncbi:PREDICTED: uncharacterized protein LOC102854676 [Elephantulus edwardii]|uniref:uncharacterized protein LOC102854676 n=1 Tax=Elephantulus edwardii TaxID=28737 RepID=UPI0003F0BE80|nr:PREDICTED: uncharacterized protein LOC102854676 [Elephantulus edwardii]